MGKPDTVNLDTGYFSADNIEGFQERGMDPYIATGRIPAGRRSLARNLPHPHRMPRPGIRYKLQTKVGKALYRLRKSTVEPVIGILKEVIGFRQFSLRGLVAAGQEWTLVCLAHNLKRLHVLRSA